MVEDQGGQSLALVVGDGELLGVVGQDADAVDAGVDHEVDRALLALEIEVAVLVEGGRGDGEDARKGAPGIGRAAGRRHLVLLAGCMITKPTDCWQPGYPDGRQTPSSNAAERGESSASANDVALPDGERPPLPPRGRPGGTAWPCPRPAERPERHHLYARRKVQDVLDVLRQAGDDPFLPRRPRSAANWIVQAEPGQARERRVSGYSRAMASIVAGKSSLAFPHHGDVRQARRRAAHVVPATGDKPLGRKSDHVAGAIADQPVTPGYEGWSPQAPPQPLPAAPARWPDRPPRRRTRPRRGGSPGYRRRDTGSRSAPLRSSRSGRRSRSARHRPGVTGCARCSRRLSRQHDLGNPQVRERNAFFEGDVDQPKAM